jgi:hypothetical protein
LLLLLACEKSIHAFTPPLIAETVTTSPSISSEDATSTVKRRGTVAGPPLDDKPDYNNIHGPMGKTLDKVFLKVFRSKMAEKIGVDSSLPKVSCMLNLSDGIFSLGERSIDSFSPRQSPMPLHYHHHPRTTTKA